MPIKIYRRPGSSIWHYRGTLAKHRLRGTTGASDKATAARIASEIENKFYKRGLATPEEALTFPKAVALYLAAGKPDRFILPLVKHFGDTKVNDINSGTVQQAAIDIYPNAKNSTRNRQVIVPTQAIINLCAEQQRCPHLKVKRFKIETKIKVPATEEWIDTFNENATRPDIGVLAMFMFATAARISEALAVQWSDINFKKKTVLIKQTKLGNERLAHLPLRLLVALSNLPRRNSPEYVDYPFAFAGHSSALVAWDNTIERAGIEELTFHSCRHGFATTLLRRGIDVITVARLGGWKSAAHVFQTYGHAINDITLTDRIFDTGSDTAIRLLEQDQ
jgi:integrase